MSRGDSSHQSASLLRRAAVLAVLSLTACGPKPMIGGAVVMPEAAPDRAVVEGSSAVHFSWREYTFLKAVDGRPAATFACQTVKKGDFWSGVTFEWHCPGPAAAGASPTVTTEETVQAKTPGIGESVVVSVEPGEHALVVVRDVVTDLPCGLGTCGSNPAGYVHQAEIKLVAEPRHRYQARTAEADGRYWAWIVDAGSGAVVAGHAPPD